MAPTDPFPCDCEPGRECACAQQESSWMCVNVTLDECATLSETECALDADQCFLECERLGPNVRECTVTTAQNALLVVSESFDDGWHATVDGLEAAVHRVNLNMQGVSVPAGAHEVRLMYRPRAVLIGGVISALTLIAAGTGNFFARRTRRASSKK